MTELIILGAALLAIVAALSFGVRGHMQDERRIREWEARTGGTWLREGHVKKGGLNGPPQFPRPADPSALRARQP